MTDRKESSVRPTLLNTPYTVLSPRHAVTPGLRVPVAFQQLSDFYKRRRNSKSCKPLFPHKLCVCNYTCAHTTAHTHARTHACAHTCTNSHTRTYARTRTHTRTHAHTHKHTHAAKHLNSMCKRRQYVCADKVLFPHQGADRSQIRHRQTGK